MSAPTSITGGPIRCDVAACTAIALSHLPCVGIFGGINLCYGHAEDMLGQAREASTERRHAKGATDADVIFAADRLALATRSAFVESARAPRNRDARYIDAAFQETFDALAAYLQLRPKEDG